MRELKDGIRSLVKLDFYGNVHKTFRGTDADKRADNEARVLKVLEERECPNVPRLLEYDAETLTIITTSCGSPAPNLTKHRADLLFEIIEHEYGVVHDDPEPRNVTYNEREGHFCVIDFELATVIEDFEVGKVPQSEEAKSFPVVDWQAMSVSGTKKPENDDAFMVMSVGVDRSGELPDAGECSLFATDLLLAVSDGMGGGNAGDLASRLTLEKMAELVPATMQAVAQGKVPNYEEQLERAILSVHRSINHHAGAHVDNEGMGATLTLLWFTPEQLYVAHVGDSRLYRHRGGETEQLTEDHNLAWKSMQRGELSEYQYRAHPRRAALYECIGAGHARVRPAVKAFSYKKGDRYLICSDGITDGLWEKVIHNIFCENSLSTKLAAESFITRAVESDGTDDTTAIVLKVT